LRWIKKVTGSIMQMVECERTLIEAGLTGMPYRGPAPARTIAEWLLLRAQSMDTVLRRAFPRIGFDAAEGSEFAGMLSVIFRVSCRGRPVRNHCRAGRS
jgi:hypothetical protein